MAPDIFCLIVFVPLSVLHITLLRRYLLVPFLVGRICCISSFCGRALLGFHSLSHTLPVQLSGHSTGAAVIPFFSLVSQVGVGYYYYYYLPWFWSLSFMILPLGYYAGSSLLAATYMCIALASCGL